MNSIQKQRKIFYALIKPYDIQANAWYAVLFWVDQAVQSIQWGLDTSGDMSGWLE